MKWVFMFYNILVPKDAGRAVVGQTQLFCDDSLHFQSWQSQAYDEHAEGEVKEHSVWGLPRLQGDHF